MAQTLVFLLLSSCAPISLEYSPEISQERKALRQKSAEAIEIFNVGQLVTWKFWRRIRGEAFSGDDAEVKRYRKVPIRIWQDKKRTSGRRLCFVWKMAVSSLVQAILVYIALMGKGKRRLSHLTVRHVSTMLTG